MKVKNLCQNHIANTCAQMALDLHDIKVEWVDDHADLLVFDAFTNYQQVKENSAKLKLCFDIQHAEANKHRSWSNVGWILDRNENTFAVIECEDPGFHNNQILFYDFIWNRSKSYYLDKNWNVSNPWYYTGKEAFYLQPISSAEQKTRLFLSPNSLGRLNAVYRARFVEVIQRYDVVSLGYYSILSPNQSSINLLPNRRDGSVKEVKDIDQSFEGSGRGGGYDPIHNAYYNETFFSAYVETFETGTSQIVTEKTIEPLIKGHFILPFGAPNFISYVRQQGWRLPEFIDYSYDSIDDDELRFRKFKKEFDRLCSISMDTWRQHWFDNTDILEYNRNQLYNRPYHYLEVLKNGNTT